MAFLIRLVFQGKEPGEMVVEERIEAADRRKVDGNELFKEGKIAEAMQQYEMVTTYYVLKPLKQIICFSFS